MAKKLGFLDSLFDVNGDGKVDNTDFMDDYAIYQMMHEDEEAERENLEQEEIDELETRRDEKRDLMESLGLDPDDYGDDELDELDEDDIENLAEEAREEKRDLMLERGLDPNDYDDNELDDLDEDDIENLAEEALEEAREEKRDLMLEKGLNPDDYDDDELDELDEDDIERLAEELFEESESEDEEPSELDELEAKISFVLLDKNATVMDYHWAGINMLPLFVDKAKEICDFDYDYGDEAKTYGMIWSALLYDFILDLGIEKQRRISLYDCLCDKLCLELSGCDGEEVFDDENPIYKQFPAYIENVLELLAIATLIADGLVQFSDFIHVLQVLAESASEDAEEEYPEVRNQAFENKIGSLGSSAWERAEARVNTEN